MFQKLIEIIKGRAAVTPDIQAAYTKGYVEGLKDGIAARDQEATNDNLRAWEYQCSLQQRIAALEENLAVKEKDLLQQRASHLESIRSFRDFNPYMFQGYDSSRPQELVQNPVTGAFYWKDMKMLVIDENLSHMEDANRRLQECANEES